LDFLNPKSNNGRIHMYCHKFWHTI